MGISLAICLTMLSSLHADHMATARLFQVYGPWAEANPVIRRVGPAPYYALWYTGVAVVACRNEHKPEVRPVLVVAALTMWAVQTWAVSTHERTGTNVSGPPLLYFTVTW